MDEPLRETGSLPFYLSTLLGRQASRAAFATRLSEYHPMPSERAPSLASQLPVPFPTLKMCFIPALFGWKDILPSFIEGHKIYSVFFLTFLHNIYIFYCINVICARQRLNKTFMAKALSAVTFGPLSIIRFYMQRRGTNAGQMFKCGLSV